MLQHTITAVLVLAAFGYSAWALMPAAWRSRLRQRLGMATPEAGGGCGGCGGCAGLSPAAKAGLATITVHRRAPAPSDTPHRATPHPDESAGAAAP